MQVVQFQVSPEQAKDDSFLKNRIKTELGIDSDDFSFYWRKRSIDARKRQIKVNCSFEVFIDEEREQPELFSPQDVSQKKEIAIIGAGPAGLFAALEALEVGLKPIVFERGKDPG